MAGYWLNPLHWGEQPCLQDCASDYDSVRAKNQDYQRGNELLCILGQAIIKCFSKLVGICLLKPKSGLFHSRNVLYNLDWHISNSDWYQLFFHSHWWQDIPCFEKDSLRKMIFIFLKKAKILSLKSSPLCKSIFLDPGFEHENCNHANGKYDMSTWTFEIRFLDSQHQLNEVLQGHQVPQSALECILLLPQEYYRDMKSCSIDANRDTMDFVGIQISYYWLRSQKQNWKWYSKSYLVS